MVAMANSALLLIALLFWLHSGHSFAWAAIITISVLVGLLLLLAINQNSLIYQPDTPTGARHYIHLRPSDQGLEYEVLLLPHLSTIL